MTTPLTRKQLTKDLNSYLDIYSYSDYGPNGLQIEGTEDIKKIAFAVSATKDSVAQAVSWGADALIVHHGLFWKFHGVRTLTGPFAARVLPLVKNNINLFGYHLPLDAHLESGNAAAVAARLDLQDIKPFGDYKGMPTGVQGKFKTALKPQELQEKLADILDHQVLHAKPDDEDIKSIGIITGGANGDWVHANRLGLDAYLTGEMSEHDWHEAQESGVHMFAGGHHATEQFGIQALQEYIARQYKVETTYIDSQNPA